MDQLKCGRLVPEGEGDTKPTAIVYVGTSDRYEMMIKLNFPECSRIFTYKYDQQRSNSISSRLLFDSFIFFRQNRKLDLKKIKNDPSYWGVQKRGHCQSDLIFARFFLNSRADV